MTPATPNASVTARLEEALERETPNWGIRPVPESLRRFSGLDLAVLWGDLSIGLLVLVSGALLVPALGLPIAALAIVIGALTQVSPATRLAARLTSTCLPSGPMTRARTVTSAGPPATTRQRATNRASLSLIASWSTRKPSIRASSQASSRTGRHRPIVTSRGAQSQLYWYLGLRL